MLGSGRRSGRCDDAVGDEQASEVSTDSSQSGDSNEQHRSSTTSGDEEADLESYIDWIRRATYTAEAE
eukprot:8992681-Karenia_brevis.AAC.1